MKTRKESIVQLAFAISGWASKRGQAYLKQNQEEFQRCDKIIDYWIEHLEKKVAEEGQDDKGNIK